MLAPVTEIFCDIDDFLQAVFEATISLFIAQSKPATRTGNCHEHE